MIDLHSHLLPRVDDGARDPDEALAGIRRLLEAGVHHIVTTPHFAASIARNPNVFRQRQAILVGAWAWLRAACRDAFPDLSIDIGREVLIDISAPDFSDPSLRLAGGRFVLIEFPLVGVPPRAVEGIDHIGRQGYVPVVAHPERYRFEGEPLKILEEWRAAGALFQVNAAALAGRYGAPVQQMAWELIQRGKIDFAASDYHSRGRPWLREARSALERRGGAGQARLLFEENPRRLLKDESPTPVPPLNEPRSSRRGVWRRLYPFSGSRSWRSDP